MLSKKIENKITQTQKEHYKEMKAWLNVNPDIHEAFTEQYKHNSLESYIEDKIVKNPEAIALLAKELQYPETHRMFNELNTKPSQSKSHKMKI